MFIAETRAPVVGVGHRGKELPVTSSWGGPRDLSSDPWLVCINKGFRLCFQGNERETGCYLFCVA